MHEHPSAEHSIVFLPTRSLDKVHELMVSLLPNSLILDQGACRIYRVGGGFWGFCASMDTLPHPERIVLTIVTEDVAAFYGRVTEFGIPCDGEPRANERFRIFHFYAEFPDGYRLEVQRFLHPFP